MIDLIKEKEIFKKLLKDSKKIILVNHRRMDPDAFGSLSGFYYILKQLGEHELFVTNEETTPESFKFLNDEEIFTPNLDFDKIKPDLIITFDVASIEQLGEIYTNNLNYFKNTLWVNLDHHISNELFGNINIVDTSCSSTCEIVWDLIKDLNYTHLVNQKISSFLLAGLITDTNSFFNSNTSPKAFLTASELMFYKPKHQEIIINFFKKKPYNRLKLWGEILKSLKDIKDSKIVWNIVPKSLFIQTQTTNKDITGLLDEFLMTINTLEVGFLLYELDDGSIKGTFRAKSDLIDLSLFCSNWGGGGHKRASGFIVNGKNIYEVESEVINKLSALI
ncbi:bifunctional oligoribonuclease/PAP phosphatase NrnA [Candidatus Gracilibacteria bacterium]|nr:bifunctional oligoribonuclease/PAP phosphatase NrnA [Candidatus Gracilibacteria bacterium]